MTGFLKWFFVFMTEMLKGFSMIFKGLWNGIKQIFNIKNYIQIFKTYSTDFGALGWVLSIIAIILVAGVFVQILSARAGGYWTRQFDVPAWGGQDDPLPFEVLGAPQPQQPPVYAAP